MSNEPTIEQMDLAIARFMGMEGSDDFNRQNYKYHSSWNLLMPCWKKAGEVLYNIRGDLAADKYIESHRITNSFMNACQKVEIGIAHRAVYNAVQFIQRYNKQSTTTNDTTTGNKG